MTNERTVTIRLSTLARMLEIALAYGSRTDRIRALLRAAGSGSFVAAQLRYAGYLTDKSCSPEPTTTNTDRSDV